MLGVTSFVPNEDIVVSSVYLLELENPPNCVSLYTYYFTL